MSIVVMSRLSVIAPRNVRRPLLKELTKLGCVEVGASADRLTDPDWAAVAEKFAETDNHADLLSQLNAAHEVLAKYAPHKSGFLSPRRMVSESAFQDEGVLKSALEAAERLNGYGREIAALYSEEGRLTAKKASLAPWADLDVPFGASFGHSFKVLFGVTPAAGANPTELTAEVEGSQAACLKLVNSDREQNYFLLVVHNDSLEAVMDIVKAKGFSTVSFKDVEGTAAENIRQVDAKLKEVEIQRQAATARIQACADQREAIEQAIDVLGIENRRDQVLNNLIATKETVFLEGWTPKDAEASVAAVLEKYGCAYSFDSPAEGEEPPVLLRDPKVIEPFGMVTELYALPTYESNLDPNPFMAPFFFIFFGLMMGDLGYGIIISLVAWFILKTARPPEGGAMRKLMKIGLYCGFSTMIWGVLFGSFFGNLIPAFTGSMLGHEITIKPLLFDPMADPMSLFYLSLAFGFIQIFLGMGLQGYQLIRRGQVFDAVCDIGFWFLILGGVPVCLLNVNVGLILMAVGAAGVLLTGGRAKKGLGKITGGLGSLYGITSYLSDILSYSRLLALSLATAVIAQVMNTMGTLAGSTVAGWILFIVVFVVGHIFNVAINILGTYVHTSRLQYIEFFGKFYEPGGRKFEPLFNKTKYVEIAKEGK